MAEALIKIKRSATDGAEPTTDDLELGEIAINTFNGRIFLKTYDGDYEIQKFLNLNELLQTPLSIDNVKDLLGDGLSVSEDNKIIVTDTSSSDDSTTSVDDECVTLADNYQDMLISNKDYSYSIQYDGDEYSIRDGGEDVYDDGNYIEVNGIDLSYNDAIFKQYGFLLFELNDVESIEFSGNTGADGRGDVLTDSITFELSDTCSIKSVYKVIENGRGGDPSIHHIIFVNSDVDVDHSYSDDTDDDSDRYSFDRSCKVYLLIYWSASATAWDSGNYPLETIFNNLFKGEN